MRKFFSFLIVLLALFVLIGCGGTEESVKPTSVTVSSTKTSVEIGNFIDLTSQVNPKEANQSVKWSSSDESIATVSNKGRVIGKAVGTAVITAASVEDEKVKGTISITVVESSGGDNPSDLVTVTAITLELSEDVFVDFDFKVTATTEPANENGQIVWSSSDETIATVSKGVIHGVKAGTCEIIAKAGEVEESLTIVVKDRPDLESFTISNLHDIDTNGVDQLGVETTPKYAKIDVVWSVDDPTVATIDDSGLLKPLKDGEVTVTARDKETNLTQTGVVKISKAFNPNEVEPSSVIISGETSCFVGYSIRLSAEVLPAGVSQEVTWSVTPEDYATIDENGVLTALKEGTVRVKATTVAGTKKISSSAYRVVIEMEIPEPK